MAATRARGALLAALLLEAVPIPLPFIQPPGLGLSVDRITVLLAGGHGEERLEDRDSHPGPAPEPRGRRPKNERQMSAALVVTRVEISPAPEATPAAQTSSAVVAVVSTVAQPPAPAARPGPVALALTPSRPVAAAVQPKPAPAPAAEPRRRQDPAAAGFPDVVLPAGPESQRLAVSLFALPLLVGIWLWAIVRLAVATLAHSAAPARAALAHQLGLRSEQLAALDLAGLRRLRDGIAFDELTGVLRRAAGLAALDRELARSARSGHPVSIAFIDVDGLKEANDTLGHAAGDNVLRGVAGVLTRRLRAQDLVFRYGGDEFVCVMPSTARPRAEAIVAEMRQMAAADGLRFSFGVAQAGAGEGARAVIGRADSLQYLDKQARRPHR